MNKKLRFFINYDFHSWALPFGVEFWSKEFISLKFLCIDIDIRIFKANDEN